MSGTLSWRWAAGLVVASWGCGSVDAPRPPKTSAALSTEAPRRPAPPRYVITRNRAVRWDGARPASVAPRSEPALVDGFRVLHDGGLVLGVSSHRERFVGFASVAERLGGGYLLWSDGATHWAESFLAKTRRRWSVGAAGGVEPWVDGILIRSAEGVLLGRLSSETVVPMPIPGIVDGRALDPRRGILVDRFGRVHVTLDGRTFRDLTQERQVRRYNAEAAEEMVALAEGRDPGMGPDDAEPPTAAGSRDLPGQPLMTAVAAGATLPSGDIVAVVDGDLVRVSSRTAGSVGRPVGLPLSDPYDQCQVLHAGNERVTLACMHEAGAHVLVVGHDPRDPRLEATFGPVTGFQVDPVGRIAAWGPCGSDEPSAHDFAQIGDDAGEGTLDALPKADEATLCVRLAPGRWEGRWIRGEASTRLYRWVLGADGTVTALVLPRPARKAAEEDEAKAPEEGPKAQPDEPVGPTRVSKGVRVVELPMGGNALRGGWFAAPQATRARRGIDRDFWTDDHGDIRGWLELPQGSSDSAPDETLTSAPAPRKLAVATDVGGPAAGITIEPSGAVVVHDPPEAVRAMVRGGPYAVAMSEPEGEARAWYETVDGGRSWRLIDGPPAEGAIEPPPRLEESGCTEAGCTWDGAIVRLGWGPSSSRSSPALPSVPGDEPESSSWRSRRAAMELSCRVRGEVPHAVAGEAVASLVVGALPEGFAGRARAPFVPGRAPRTVKGVWPGGGRLAPVLRTGGSVDFALWSDSRIAWGPDGFQVQQLERPGEVHDATAWVELGPKKYLGFEARRASLVLVDQDKAAVLTRLVEAPTVDRSSLTLARRADGALGVLAFRPKWGPVWVGVLDVGRAEVARLEPLAGFERALSGDDPACFPRQEQWRAVVRDEIDLRVQHVPRSASGPESIEEETSNAPAVLSVRGTRDRLCIDAIEVRPSAGPTRDVVARFSGRPEAAVHVGASFRAMDCELRGATPTATSEVSPSAADK